MFLLTYLLNNETTKSILQVVETAGKGRGVVTTRPFTKGEFVVEYAGDLIDLGIARQRENNYSQDKHVGCYMYYFQHKNNNYWYCTRSIVDFPNALHIL